MKREENAVAAAVIALGLGVALAAFFWTGRDGGEALAAAFSAGWAVSVVVYALSAAYYGFREKWGLEP